MQSDSIKKIAFINFGGIGDEILFAPVIDEVKKHIPQAHITLFLEDRSQAVRDLMPHVDSFIPMDIQNQSRLKAFFQLWSLLRSKYFDVVISSGSNSLIPVLLFLTGIPIRIGFGTGKASKALLTQEAYLAPKEQRKEYAADMYFTLARDFLRWLLKDTYQPTSPVIPQLKELGTEDLQWAQDKLSTAGHAKRILIHPGVSAISIQKNIIKSWPADSWAQLIQALSAEGHHVFLAGGPDDKDAVEAIRKQLPEQLSNFTDLYGQTRNLRQLAALIQASNVLIGVDSSPIHIAVGYSKPLVAMFGPTDEKKLLPVAPHIKPVSLNNLSCRPCLWDVRNENCEQSECLTVPVQAMLDAVHQVLQV